MTRMVLRSVHMKEKTSRFGGLLAANSIGHWTANYVLTAPRCRFIPSLVTIVNRCNML